MWTTRWVGNADNHRPSPGNGDRILREDDPRSDRRLLWREQSCLTVAVF